MCDRVKIDHVAKVTFSIRVNEDLKRRIESLATREHRSTSQWLALTLEEVVKQRESELIGRLLKESRNGDD